MMSNGLSLNVLFNMYWRKHLRVSFAALLAHLPIEEEWGGLFDVS